jgi:hypothetical protein
MEKLKKENNKKEDTSNTKAKQEFFKRVENLTNTTFMKEEMELLNKGLKYNLHHKPKN